MSAWVVVPSLLALREEFNLLSPRRDKGADGTIGDSSHTSTSDHTPDEDSSALRGRDADSRNEVHALDIDSSGPWPSSFDAKVKAVVAQERRRWLDPNDVCRLEYVIWNRQIYSQSHDFVPRAYSGSDPHTNHAHFSARYLTAAENDTSPWGVYRIPEPPKETAMADISDEDAKKIAKAVLNMTLGRSDVTVGMALQDVGSIGEAVGQILSTPILPRIEELEAKVDQLLGRP